ncbi:MAG TPA: ABC transporter permease subunit [Bacillota bacterium]|nr:ABC transporter permease subunit [Bacillota bacterium]
MGTFRKSSFLHEIKKNKVLYLIFLPVAIYYLVFAYLPMAGIVVAFKEFNYRDGLFFSPWNGLKNFEYLYTSGKLWMVTKTTIIYNVVFLSLYTFFSLLIAILISEIKSKFFKKTTQSFLFLPYFISWVVVSAFVYNFFNYDYGLVNNVLKFFGKNPLNIYSNPTSWYFLLPFLYVWKWVGFGSVLYLAAIMGFDQECYEAADIDGANAFQKIRYITLPLLKPTVIILLLLGVGRILRGEFDMFYNLIGNNGLLFDATDIIDTLVFRALMGIQDFGMASAGGFYQSVLCFVIILVVNAVVKKYDKDYALF